MTPAQRLTHHISGAIARGEGQAITEITPAMAAAMRDAARAKAIAAAKPGQFVVQSKCFPYAARVESAHPGSWLNSIYRVGQAGNYETLN